MSWCTIESDPGVFNEMISSLGVKNVSVEEIYSLEENEQIRDQSYGLIFLFKWQEEQDQRPYLDPFTVENLFFARQVVQNACATQAILSVLLNSSDIDIGDNLREFKSFSLALDSESRGFAIGDCDSIRLIHNSFARPEPFFSEESKAQHGQKEDAYHFIAFVPFEGKVYEIDGLKPGPILLGDYHHDWLSVAKPAIEARMNRYATSETHFALLSIRPRKATLLENEIQIIQSRLEHLTVDASQPSNQEEASHLRMHLSELQQQLQDELDILERQRQENIRRRHNYFPFVMTLLKSLSEKNLLTPMIERAQTKQTQAKNKK